MTGRRKVGNYLKTIYRLQENDLVRGVDIARDLGVTKPTVSIAHHPLGTGYDAGVYGVIARRERLCYTGEKHEEAVRDRVNAPDG